ncbi:hypothetical protein ASPWEDRAFT_48229 [Aspergillus wentii DTO 134E9]|uniref:Mmc1 C-terminal domain-containing protein n=1 Tax=Aspergillus wentii DTO 134E9 TaxID=1073089 RepID=A0A1L9S3J2_ASPWE|nr:uncharacterized protein ASPWEDRAFT_48229 [Aspergillus wentii DTO 134E9]KAI9930052.1 hypothetical protein MW887_011862 [Aspergillus wentii]OJJ41714.1 hypothetical protein ASPWEDRAFT_48229 [Aspergillus wentii DTO 134E9]
MPPKLRGSLQTSLSRPLNSGGVFYCPSCTTWRRTLSTRSSIVPRRRPSSSNLPTHRPLATSVVNAARNVPPRFKELYEALNRVGDTATEQVNLSRLQLALRGLESEAPLIRVAVLGLNDATAARKLVRLLLADPLNARENWEDVLEDVDPSRGLLIRYGEVSQSIPNDLLPTISVPSPVLKKGNLEILVTSLGAEANPSATQFTADTFLVPTVTIQTSHSGRHNVVRYPVHKSIVCGRGVDGLFAYSGLLSRSNLKSEAQSVYGAIDLSVGDKDRGSDRISFVDIDKAEQALEVFRESVQNASLYERGWSSSGVQPVIDWLASLRAGEGNLEPSLRTLILSLLEGAEEGVLAKEASGIEEQNMGLVPSDVRRTMDRSVTAWAENAHTELQGSLEEGFASRQWRDLAWWKLFWHVDDVGMITSEILEKRYLRRAEKEVIWTAGKFQQAGLLDEPQKNAADSETKEQGADSPKQDLPWPTQIPASRAQLLDTSVSSLQSLAQRLVFFSVSTTSLTSALSALTYVSFPSASVYETCTMAAVGLIYSLRAQQRKWDAARNFWEDEVRENGRMSLLETEKELRRIVHEGGRQVEDITEGDARETIERAKKALEDVQ